MSKKQTLAEINNNPLNIRFNENNQWRGQTGQNRGFCVFSSEAYGIRAGYKILTNYIKWGVNTTSSTDGHPHQRTTQKHISASCVMKPSSNPTMY